MTNTVLVYGKTGSTKTSQLGDIAQALIKYYSTFVENPVIRMITADSGWGPIDDLVSSPGNPKGFIHAVDVKAFPSPFGALSAFASGRWLVERENVRTHAVEIVFSTNTLAPKNVIAYFIEGLNTIADLLLQDHIDTGRKITDEVYGKNPVTAESEKGTLTYTIGAPGRSHYLQVQKFVLSRLLPDFTGILREDGTPIPWMVFTAHEAMGEDDFTQRPIIGPAVIGKAVTATVPQKFQDCIHMQKIVDSKTGKLELRGYFRDHPEMSLPVAGGFQLWPAKVSFPPKVMQKILLRSEWKDGYFPITFDKGLGQLIDLRLGVTKL